MALLVFALIVIILTALLVWGVSTYLPLPQPFGNVICLLIIVIAVVVIAQKAGLV